MIDFSTVKGITIPEGVVKKIECNGVVLWKASSYEIISGLLEFVLWAFEGVNIDTTDYDFSEHTLTLYNPDDMSQMVNLSYDYNDYIPSLSNYVGWVFRGLAPEDVENGNTSSYGWYQITNDSNFGPYEFANEGGFIEVWFYLSHVYKVELDNEPGGGSDSGDSGDTGGTTTQYCACGAPLDENGNCTEMNGPGCEGWVDEDTVYCPFCGAVAEPHSELEGMWNCPNCGDF